MYKFIIGIDVSKAKIDIAYTSDGEPIYLGYFDNTENGFEQMQTALSESTNVIGSEWFFCFENTGSYSKLLLEWLNSNGYFCCEESALRISNSLGLKRGKSDKIDSEDICTYAFEKQHKLKPTALPDAVILELRDILSYREILVKQKQGLKICLKDKNVRESKMNELRLINNEIIKKLKDSIKELDRKLELLIKKEEKLEKNYKLLQSIVGIGLINAIQIICSTENFTKIKDSRKMAANCGIAPYPKESGTKKSKRRISKIGNRKLKALLSNAACSAIRHDHELKAYYQRKMAENKSFGTVLNAVKNKLLHRVFAVVKRQTPYINLEAYKY